MNDLQLKRGVELQGQIEHTKEQIAMAKYTQMPEVVEREAGLTFNGVEGILSVPEELFRAVGLLILSAHSKKLIDLEREFVAL